MVALVRFIRLSEKEVLLKNEIMKKRSEKERGVMKIMVNITIIKQLLSKLSLTPKI